MSKLSSSRRTVLLSIGLVASLCACGREKPSGEGAPLPKERSSGPEPGAPSVEMAQNFEGRAHVLLKRPEGPLDIRYSSRGGRSRLEVDDQRNPARDLDLIFENERSAVLLNGAKQYFDVELGKGSRKSETPSGVREVSSGGRKSLHGLTCNEKELIQPGQRISACVVGLPGGFDSGRFAALTGVTLPPWIVYLFNLDLWPATAVVRNDVGRELYTIEVQGYSSQPVPEAELAIPQNYTRIEPRVPLFPPASK